MRQFQGHPSTGFWTNPCSTTECPWSLCTPSRQLESQASTTQRTDLLSNSLRVRRRWHYRCVRDQVRALLRHASLSLRLHWNLRIWARRVFSWFFTSDGVTGFDGAWDGRRHRVQLRLFTQVGSRSSTEPEMGAKPWFLLRIFTAFSVPRVRRMSGKPGSSWCSP